MPQTLNLFAPTAGDWKQRLAFIVETMRQVSVHTDPQAMVRAYTERMRHTMPMDRLLSLSRRGVSRPRFLIARDSMDERVPNPWTQRDRLSMLEGGLLGELIYSNEPHLIQDLRIEGGDPAAGYLAGYRSLVAVPVFDGGEALNVVVFLKREPHGFDPQMLPQLVWTTNLFGRATHNLVLSQQVKRAHDALDQEMKIIADIQRSMLPAELPEIPGVDLAAYYQPAHRAGGDYYDLFPLEGERWGLLIADVSGHGSPAAVHMAITHTLAHTHPSRCASAPRLLEYLNRHLSSRYTTETGTFVTAFFGVYDPPSRRMDYAIAGHHPPRVKRCGDGSLFALDGPSGLPLGILPDARYEQHGAQLLAGDQIVFYTDGVTEARNCAGEMFGVERLEGVLADCRLDAADLIDDVLRRVDEFTGDCEPDDDRTLVVAKVGG